MTETSPSARDEVASLVLKYLSADPMVMAERIAILEIEREIKSALDGILQDGRPPARKGLYSSFYFSATEASDVREEATLHEKCRRKGRCVGCQNHRGLIKVMDFLIAKGKIPEEEFSTLLAARGINREQSFCAMSSFPESMQPRKIPATAISSASSCTSPSLYGAFPLPSSWSRRCWSMMSRHT
jgi:hypothetical protein